MVFINNYIMYNQRNKVKNIQNDIIYKRINALLQKIALLTIFFEIVSTTNVTGAILFNDTTLIGQIWSLITMMDPLYYSLFDDGT